jgi:molybdopterin-biosynthesis enzyme MoeA-like protein
MNDARRKMARLPRGATPLRNSVGGAPGVLIRVDRAGAVVGDWSDRCATSKAASRAAVTMVSLPGVPAELRAIVDESLGDILLGIFGGACFEERVLVVDTQDESAIAHVLAAVEQAHPLVYIKSRAQRIGSEHVNRITAAARGADPDTLTALLDRTMADLRRDIAAEGFAATPEQPD